MRTFLFYYVSGRDEDRTDHGVLALTIPIQLPSGLFDLFDLWQVVIQILCLESEMRQKRILIFWPDIFQIMVFLC
jgi:hypothetical protein